MSAYSDQKISLNREVDANVIELWRPRILCLGPGAVKGLMHLGCLFALEQDKLLQQVDTYIGCSVGSAIALLLNVGYKSQKIANDVIEASLMDEWDNIDVKTIERKGINKHDAMFNFLTERMQNKYGKTLTFAQLYQVSNKRLTVVASSVNGSCPEYFSAQTHPHMSVIDAVIMSCNIPGVFRDIKYQGNYYVDGALSDPFPIGYYDDGQTPQLALRIISEHMKADKEVEYDTVAYFLRIMYMPINNLRRQSQKKCSAACRFIKLHGPGIEGFKISLEEKRQLFMFGYDSGLEFRRKLYQEFHNSIKQ